MAWTNEAVAGLEKSLTAGSIFGNLEEINARKFSDLQVNTTFELQRFEIFLKTEKHADPYVTLELNGAIYSGYARAIGNQLFAAAKQAAKDPANETTVTDLKAYSEIPVGAPVHFIKNRSAAGEYLQLVFGAPESE
jgi:hypothetical protein